MVDNLYDLSGKVALVTGSTRGIGKAIAEQLLLQNAVVITNSGNREKESKKTGFDSSATDHYICDVTKDSEVKQMVKDIYDKHGRIDILVNNVGASAKEAIIGSTESIMDSLYEKNLKSVFLVTKCVLKYMLKQRSGNIIQIGSVAGMDGMGMQAHYAAFKSALSGYTKSVILEYGGRGIRANIISAGALDENSLYSKEEEEAIVKKIPLKRLGTVKDIANTAGFLASEMSSYINGQVIRVDGGLRI